MNPSMKYFRLNRGLLMLLIGLFSGQIVRAAPDKISDFWLDVNRMKGVFRNNGIWMYDCRNGNWGLEWPKGSGLSPIFAAGLNLGASVNGEVRVAGVVHSATEYQPGNILAADSAADRTNPAFRWYELSAGGVGDWHSWPVEQGAPLAADGQPLFQGDETAFCVYNDYTTHDEYGSAPLGAEVRQLLWAYDRQDLLGDVIFIQVQLVNKSAHAWDSTYFSIWADPDLGYAGDDYVGCDTLLNLGYCYNAFDYDEYYGQAPPATGFLLLQGPLADAIGQQVQLPDGNTFVDKVMRPMTAFVFYSGDDSPFGNPTDAQELYYFQQGRWRDGRPITDDGEWGHKPEYSPIAYMFYGDPESGTGWLSASPADRRFVMSTGPFDMPVWEDSNNDGLAELGEPGVQELLIAVLCARGTSHVNSVTRLKESVELVQALYQGNFQAAEPPMPPNVEVSECSQEIVLTWDDCSEYNADGSSYSVEDAITAFQLGDTILTLVNGKVVSQVIIDDCTYNFYGYSVYQYLDTAGNDPVQLFHWDMGEIKEPIPYSGARFVRILENRHPLAGAVGSPLINGKRYYYGVVAEAYLQYGDPEILESAREILCVVPKAIAGERFGAVYGDVIETSYHDAEGVKVVPPGKSATVTVIDPSRLTGHDYRICFDGLYHWQLLDETIGDTVLAHQTNFRGDEAYNPADGLLVQVQGPEPGIYEIVQLDPYTNELIDWNLWQSLNAINGVGGSPDPWTRGGGAPGFFLDCPAGVLNGPYGEQTLDQYKLLSPYDIEILFGSEYESIAWGYQSGPFDHKPLLEKVPFAVFLIDPTGRIPSPYRLYIAIADQQVDGTEGYWDLGVSSGLISNSGWEEIFAFYSDLEPYDPAKDNQYLAAGNLKADPAYTGLHGPHNPFIYPLLNHLIISMYPPGTEDAPAAETVIRINTYIPYLVEEYFTFTSPEGKKISDTALKEDFKELKVVPNPYFGTHSEEQGSEQWVRFTYLPEKCTVRILNLAGELIRKLEKDDPTTPFLEWDLRNAYGRRVASGVYVYFVEVPGIGIRTGKLVLFIGD